ncbi:chitinase [Paenibacillus sp. SYP-B3998]|uniref:chitinase n=1 Tax=Paenibacillus sp. SYP-B3998 TaxID=2678564 RepID=A0A6G3ZZ40_9BACL|nr:glycosyl hydrolase family 18 protein [Paenibacillus sp. SYP-B3998]NEW07486.1 chitinase [Paenibacillus sp. SYP-B3998]
MMSVQKKVVNKVLLWTILFALMITLFPVAATKASAATGKIIVGYWHNFDNGSGFIRLRDVSSKFDVINVSFAEPTGATNGTIGFTPYSYTDADFKADVTYLKGIGKKVIISIGGANGQVQLTTTAARDNFVNSVTTIIEKYGFDGLDVDFEGHSLYLNAGDSDFKNPTTPVIVNLIAALKAIKAHFGSSFVLTMAPETFFVQLGYAFYGGSCSGCDSRAGAYLPVIYAVRDSLNWLQVQNYNSGPITGLDDQYHTMGVADFHVAMLDMILTGFPVAKNANNFFPALRQDQVVLGLPAYANAGGGFTTVSEVQKALDYVIKGIPFGSYRLHGSPSGYPDLKGLMTWSVNWDKFNNFEFSNSHRSYLDNIGTTPDTQAPSVPSGLVSTGKTQTSVSLSWNASTDNKAVTGYDVYNGSQLALSVTGTSAMVSGLTSGTTYSFTVKAKDAAGNVSATSSALVVTTLPTTGVDTQAPTIPTNLASTGKTQTSISLSWTASTDNTVVAGYDVYNGSQLALSVTGTSATVNGLTSGTAYTFTVKAKDVAGNVSVASAALTVTTDSTSSVQPWAPYVAYKINDLVTYSGKTYKVVQGHTSLPGWEPVNVPALWSLVN